MVRHRFNILNVIGLIIVSVIAVVSCDRPTQSEGEFFTLKDAVWIYGDTLLYNNGGDSITPGADALLFSVRHTNRYRFANLWIEVSYNTPDTVAADTFNIVLADDYGKWLGSGSGPVILKTDTLKLRSLPSADARFGIRHIMRLEQLDDVEQIGICPISLISSK